MHTCKYSLSLSLSYTLSLSFSLSLSLSLFTQYFWSTFSQFAPKHSLAFTSLAEDGSKPVSLAEDGSKPVSLSFQPFCVA